MNGPIIRYLNLNGAQVGVFESQAKAGHPALSYRSGCTGCLETFGSAEEPEALNGARIWAVKHSQTCHALPQPEESRSGYLTLSVEYAERAVEIMRGNGTQTELRDRNASATVYIQLSETYARLSRI